MAILTLDTGSALASVAVLDGSRVAVRSLPQRQSAAPLLRLVNECLGEAGLTPKDLEAIVALAGPGSFTGLRVGLATALGLHQALGIPAGALPTLPVLARAAADAERVVAAVDALRGEWFVQVFEGGRPRSEPERLPVTTLQTWPAATWVGFGIGLVPELPGTRLEPPPLAPLVGELWLAQRPLLAPASLSQPLYLRAPALSAPRPPKRVG